MEKKISRSKLLDTIRQFEPGTLVAMEACATSHFWGRTFASMGYCVRLIPAQHVKAFVRSQKNDANDALAICETAFRPGIHFVSVKTTEQQDIKALRNTRQLMVEQRTALANQLRSLLAEYGFTIPVGILHLQQQLPELIEDVLNSLKFTLRRLLSSLREDMQALNERITSLDTVCRSSIGVSSVRPFRSPTIISVKGNSTSACCPPVAGTYLILILSFGATEEVPVFLLIFFSLEFSQIRN